MSKEKGIRPFSNGSQYLDFEASNCGRCKKRATIEQISSNEVPCKIEEAIGLASIDDGKITHEIATRMGYFDNNPPKTKNYAYVWQCGEVEWTEEWKAKCAGAVKEPA